MPERTVQFDMTSAFGFAAGYRLQRLEVFNWGTFDAQVQSFSPEGGTALITGESGSGKSTLVDAMLTLLIAPRRVQYNKAADESSRERNLSSYIRGFYGSRRGMEGVGQAEALRGFDTYSVILAVFFDPGLGRTVSLAKAFRYTDVDKPPEALYVVAQRELGIVADFALDDGGFQALKKRLADTEQIDVFDSYTRYGELFRRLMGIEDVNTLNLFQQTVAMKRVDELTSFVRSNMLEDPEPGPEIEKLIEHFSDLDSAHGAVVKAKEQISQLDPLVKEGKRRLDRIAEREQINAARQVISAWFANQRLALIETEQQRLDKAMQLAVSRLDQTESLLKAKREEEDRLKVEIYASGGAAIESLKAEIAKAETTLGERIKRSEHYAKYAAGLGLGLPSDAEAFAQNQSSFTQLKATYEDSRSQSDERFQEAAASHGAESARLLAISEELASLRERSSSIPKLQVDLRQRLCTELGLPAEELPFVGELIEVLADEAEWEGAIERLLRSFGLSILVPEGLYQPVMEWVDRNDLKARLVYYRVPTDQTFASGAAAVSSTAAATVTSKLAIKPDSACFGWLRNELQQRFPHVCTPDAQSFRREANALSRLGQIKTRGGRHEKDDRFGIQDRSRYILGFTNSRKIAALTEQEGECQRLVDTLQTQMLQVRQESQRSIDLLGSIAMLEIIERFEEIDHLSVDKTLASLKEQLAWLEEGDDVLAALGRELEAVLLRKAVLEEQQDQQKQARYQLEAEIATTGKLREEAESLVLSTGFLADDERAAYLDAHAEEALGPRKHGLDNSQLLQEAYYRWLDGKGDACSASIEMHNGSITRRMTEFNNHYYEETREIEIGVESLPDYMRLLERLRHDDLPRFEKRFKAKLNEGTINQIALFQSQLDQFRGTIRKRIEQINLSLAGIDYNEGRYIRLEYNEAPDSQIREFREELRLCTTGALGDSHDEQYAESKFMQVKRLIDRFKGRPGETEADARWTRKVTDVRNWFTFAASERWRETDEEYEYYTDSDGKSGGQKEKLAYMVLAASLVYHYGLSEDDARSHCFRLVIIDEAFLKSSDESAKFGLELFRRLDLQLLIVTPLLKIHTIEPYISHVGFVSYDDISHRSRLRNLSISEYREERAWRESQVGGTAGGAGEAQLDGLD